MTLIFALGENRVVSYYLLIRKSEIRDMGWLSWAMRGVKRLAYFLRSRKYSEANLRLAAAGSFISSLCLYVYPQNFLSPTIWDLKMLKSSVFHQNVDLSSLLRKFISDFENPFRKTSERRNSQFSVIFFLDTVIYRH